MRSPWCTLLGMGLVVDNSALIPLFTCAKPAQDVITLAKLLPNVSLRRLPRSLRIALLAANDALFVSHCEPKEMGLVVGTSFGCTSMGMDFLDSLLDKGCENASPTAFSYSVTNICAGTLSISLGIQGPMLTLSEKDLSFAAAVQASIAMLACGRVKRVLVGCVDEVDARVAMCLRALGESSLAESGSVFFCLGKEQEAGVPIAVQSTRIKGGSESGCSISWQMPFEKKDTLCAAGSLAQAFFTAYAFDHGICGSIACRDAMSGQEMTIFVGRESCAYV